MIVPPRCTSVDTNALYRRPSSRVSFRNETWGRTLIFPTNHLALPAKTIAALDKSRWEIELFFKRIKDNLRVKALYGTSPNAVTQTWIAVNVYLALAILENRYGLQPSLSKLLHLFKVNLLEPKLLISTV